jgi:hypothetical protein
MAELDKAKAIHLLNRILEAELAGVVRYTHYSFLLFGHTRITGRERSRRSAQPGSTLPPSASNGAVSGGRDWSLSASIAVQVAATS